MISDIELVFKNCIDYNEDSSPTFSNTARELVKDFTRQLKKAGLNEHDDKPITDKNLLEFSKGIYNISTVDLGACSDMPCTTYCCFALSVCLSVSFLCM